MNVSDSKHQYLHETLDLMESLGGSFVEQLAKTCRVADDTNFRKLVETFPKIFDLYAGIAARAAHMRNGDGLPMTFHEAA